MIFESIISRSRPLDRFRECEKVIKAAGGSLDEFKRLDSDKLLAESNRMLMAAKSRLSKLPVNSEMADSKYVTLSVSSQALSHLSEWKKNRDKTQVLDEGSIYYVAKSSNGRVTGRRSIYLGEDREDSLSWKSFNADENHLKVLHVLRHGSDDDFTKLYVDMADGRPATAALGYDSEHITESSKEAIREMANYCDSRWEGSWPWEITAPKKIRDIIERNDMTRNERIAAIRESFDRDHDDLFEGEIEQSEIMVELSTMIEKISRMISDVGRIQADAMTTLKDEVRTSFGDDAAHRLEDATHGSVGTVVDALGSLRDSLKSELDALSSGAGEDPMADFTDVPDDGLDGELGAPSDLDPEADPEAELDMDDDEEDLDSELGDERDKK